MQEPQISGTILVVDDEIMNIMVLKGVLGNAGYRVLSATSGAEALATAKAERPDMVLLDVMMPVENGFDTCRKLKDHADTAHMPVIFVTCLDEMSSKLEGLDLGAVDYITKPFMAYEVVARVRSHMNFKRALGAIIDAQARRLNQVQDAQRAMLVRPETLPEARFAVQFMPVLEAGGDYYDVLSLGRGQYAYLVADVSGHDLGASFITSSLKALFRQHAAADASPALILAAMNRILCAITPEELYLTAVCLLVDRERGRYSLSSAGHPAVLSQLQNVTRFLDLSGLPLGMFEAAEFDVLEGPVREGDRFFLYSDGLAENAGHYVTSEAFRQNLVACCQRNAVLPLSSAVLCLLRDGVGPREPVDDVVVLGVGV